MALNRTASTRCEKVQAFPALAMALFEQSGLTELIDSRFEIGPKIKLTPGNAVKALVGMFTSESRRPIYNASHPFMSAPVDLMLGPNVDVRARKGVPSTGTSTGCSESTFRNSITIATPC